MKHLKKAVWAVSPFIYTGKSAEHCYTNWQYSHLRAREDKLPPPRPDLNSQSRYQPRNLRGGSGAAAAAAILPGTPSAARGTRRQLLPPGGTAAREPNRRARTEPNARRTQEKGSHGWLGASTSACSIRPSLLDVALQFHALPETQEF